MNFKSSQFILLIFLFTTNITAIAKTEYFRQIALDGNFDIVGRYPISESAARQGAAYRLTYNNNGLEKVEYTINGHMKENDLYFHAGQIKIEHMDDGWEKRSYYNYKGKPTRDIVSGAYSVRIHKDEDNNTISLYNYNKTNSLMKDKYGVAHYLCYLDDEGRRSSSIRFDVAGNRVTDKEGFYELLSRYDDEGNVVEQLNYDEDGKLMDDKDYFTSIRRAYDENGNIIDERFYGIDGELKLHTFVGVAMIKRAYDDQGRIIEERYFGIDEMPRERVKYSGFSYAMIRYNYGTDGEIKKVVYLDKNERKL